MKITLTSSLGNIGKPLTKQLINDGHEVTVISHSTDRKNEIEKLGAKPKIGSLEDLDFLMSAFKNTDAVFLLNPPDYSKSDIREYYRLTNANYAEAVKKNKIQRVVQLSSFGAHLNFGTGPILGSHFAEEIIKQVPNIDLTILRPTYFYYNLCNYIDMIKYTGQIVANYGQTKFPLVSSKDIANAVAEELTTTKSKLFRYVVSSEHTGQEIATVLGKGIGKTDLEWKIVSDEEVKKGMEQNGIPSNIANLFTEMYASLANGKLTENYENNKPIKMGTVTLEDFAIEFAEMYIK